MDGFVVPAGQTVEIDGTLESTGNVIVRGTLVMRPGATLRFVNVDESEFGGGGLEVLGTDVGLWVVDNGRLDIQGTPKTGWTRLGLDPTPKGWRTGDEILVCPNGKGQWTPGDFRIATFPNVNPPEPFVLPDGRELPTECANLTRDVVIEGTAGGRAHILIRSSRPQTIKHCTIRQMGPTGVLGRYPLHFHHAGDGSRGTVVEGVVVREGGNHAFVPHGSHGVTLRDCVAFDVTDHAYWWDRPDLTDDTLIDRCLAALVFTTEESKFRLSAFFLGAGTGNTVRRSAAVGVQGTKDTSGFSWPDGLGGLDTRNLRVWTFEDCVSHNNENHGAFVWQNLGLTHLVDGFVAYRCGNSGIDHGAYVNRYQWRDFQIAECDKGITWHAMGASKPPRRADGYTQAFDKGSIVSCSVGIDLGHHAVESEMPSLFKDIEFRNVPVKLRLDVGSSSAATLGDFVNTGIEPTDVDFVTVEPGSRLRFQRKNHTTWEMDDQARTRGIPAFYPLHGFFIAARGS